MSKFNLKPFESRHSLWKIYGETSLERNVVSVEYRVAGEFELVEWPAVRETPIRRWGLWEETCFELFACSSQADNKHYVEMNFSPSCDWNGFAFSAYREKQEDIGAIPDLSITSEVVEQRGIVRVSFSTAILRDYLGDKPWRLGLSAVVKGKDGDKAYFALKHSVERPDFHNPDHYIIILE